MEWVETTGSTIAAAKDAALDRLGVHEDDAEFDVVSEEKTGLFGRVKEEARVRARVRPTAPRTRDDRRRRGKGGDRDRGRNRGGGRRPEQSKGKSRDTGQGQDRGGGSAKEPNGKGRGQRQGQQKSADGGERAGDNRNSRGNRDQGERRPRNESSNQNRSTNEEKSVDEVTMPLPEQATIAEDFVKGLAECFGAEVSFERTDIEEDIHVLVSGDNLGRMIGRRGSTAMAIDELVRTVLQRQAGSSRDGRIRLDVGGVRARRAEALAVFSRQQAAEVRESGVARSLEAMGGADRKIVHDTISDEDGVDTLSEGEDPNRRVVIVPAGDDG